MHSLRGRPRVRERGHAHARRRAAEKNAERAEHRARRAIENAGCRGVGCNAADADRRLQWKAGGRRGGPGGREALSLCARACTHARKAAPATVRWRCYSGKAGGDVPAGSIRFTFTGSRFVLKNWQHVV